MTFLAFSFANSSVMVFYSSCIAQCRVMPANKSILRHRCSQIHVSSVQVAGFSMLEIIQQKFFKFQIIKELRNYLILLLSRPWIVLIEKLNKIIEYEGVPSLELTDATEFPAPCSYARPRDTYYITFIIAIVKSHIHL